MGNQIKTQIGKLGRIVTGKTPPTKVIEYFGDEYPFITPSDISDYSIKYLAKTERHLSEMGKDFQKNLLIPSDAVCFVAIGSTVGKMCFTKAKSFTNQQIHTIIVNDNKYSPHYVFYKIHFEYPKIKSIADANGAGKPIINKTDFSNIEIEVPDLPTQQKIALILSAYDDLIENNTRRIKILEEMAQTIYKEWFVNFRFPATADRPGHEKVKFVDSSLGKIPEEWVIGRLDDALVLQRGFDLPKRYRVQGGIPVYASTGITDFHNEAKAKAPGILTGRSGSLGMVIFADEDFWPLNTTLWVKEFRRATPLYAYYLLSGMELDKFNSGAAVPTLNRNDIHGLSVVLPSSDILQQFDDIIMPMFKLKKSLQKKSKTFQLTRDLLLPKLMSGEVEI